VYPGDDVAWQIGRALFDDYQRAGQAPNPGMGVWFFRVAWDIAQLGLSPQASISKHRSEWLSALGFTERPPGPSPSPSPSPGGSVTVDGRTFVKRG